MRACCPAKARSCVGAPRPTHHFRNIANLVPPASILLQSGSPCHACRANSPFSSSNWHGSYGQVWGGQHLEQVIVQPARGLRFISEDGDKRALLAAFDLFTAVEQLVSYVSPARFVNLTSCTAHQTASNSPRSHICGGSLTIRVVVRL